MPDLTHLIQSGAANPWIYLPLAMALGALHALEPGHSKSLMAAFIIAVRGNARQAATLGLSAAVGHTIVVWALAAVGLWIGDQAILDKAAPWLTFVAGLLVMSLALRIVSLTRVGAPGGSRTSTPTLLSTITVKITAAETTTTIITPIFMAPRICARMRGTSPNVLRVVRSAIAKSSCSVSPAAPTPCPAALAVLLICLQTRAFSLGFAMVAAFSVGLAATMIGVGLAAAWGARAMAGSRRFETVAARLPFVSAAIVLLVGFVMTLRGLGATGLLSSESASGAKATC